MTSSNLSDDDQLLLDLRRELTRLESERVRAISHRDRVFSVVETGDDSGHSLTVALMDLKRIEDRIEQVKNLIERKGRRLPL